MSSFAQVLESRSKIPERHVVLEPTAFGDDWPSKSLDVALGLRRIADADIQTARAEAAKFAVEMHDDREGQIEAFNDAIMRWIIVRGTCDANDVTINAPLFDGSEENVRLALTSQAIRFVWDHIERYHLECSPVVREASDEEMQEFATRLIVPGLTDNMTIGARKRFRKLIGFCLNELRELDPTYNGEPDDLDELDEE